MCRSIDVVGDGVKSIENRVLQLKIECRVTTVRRPSNCERRVGVHIGRGVERQSIDSCKSGQREQAQFWEHPGLISV